MSVSEPPVPHDLNDADERILDELSSGRNLPQNLANELDYSRQYVQNRLQMLKAADYVRNVGGGLYELVSDPRGDAVNDDTDDVDLEKVRAALLDAQSAHNDLRGDDLSDAIKRGLELLGEVVDDDE